MMMAENSANGDTKKKKKKKYVLPPVSDNLKHFVNSYTPLTSVDGIGAGYKNRLGKAGVRSANMLLKRGRTRKGRKALAAEASTSEKLLLEWVGQVDKLRVPGVGPDYMVLLEHAGVDTVPELARRNPENLHRKIMEVNKSKNLVRKPPSLKQVQAWVLKAKELPRVVEY
jgi:hypothetical protein